MSQDIRPNALGPGGRQERDSNANYIGEGAEEVRLSSRILESELCQNYGCKPMGVGSNTFLHAPLTFTSCSLQVRSHRTQVRSIAPLIAPEVRWIARCDGGAIAPIAPPGAMKQRYG